MKGVSPFPMRQDTMIALGMSIIIIGNLIGAGRQIEWFIEVLTNEQQTRHPSHQHNTVYTGDP